MEQPELSKDIVVSVEGVLCREAGDGTLWEIYGVNSRDVKTADPALLDINYYSQKEGNTVRVYKRNNF